MSFLDYLKEHRGQFIDHRAAPPARPSITALEAEERRGDTRTAAVIGGGDSLNPSQPRRLRRNRPTPRSTRFRHIQPAFAPSPYAEPLPYEEPWQRAFR